MARSAWETFLPVVEPSVADRPPALAPDWCEARGLYPGVGDVLLLVRDEVTPFVRRLEKKGLERFTILLHGSSSGVPVPAEDRRTFVHLQAVLSRKHAMVDHERWCMTRERNAEEIDTLEWRSIAEQSAWYLRLVESTRGLDVVEAVKKVHQQLHYFANMAQMRVA
jgi:hypothetical protein